MKINPPEMKSWLLPCSTVIIALFVFIPISIFLDAYNVHKPSNKNFAPVENQTFR